jgi:hypothetical protein
MKIQTLLLSLIISVPSFAATDYSKCADYVGSIRFMEAMRSGYGMSFTGLYSISGGDDPDYNPPFSIQKDGSIKTNKNVTSYEISKDGKQEVIKFKTHVNTSQSPYAVFKEKEVAVIVTRDEKGNLKEIAAAPRSKEERLAYFKGMKEYRREFAKNYPGENANYFDEVFDGSAIRFDVKNDTCLVKDAYSSYTDDEGDKEKVVSNNTELCRDLHQLFKDHPELNKCFDPGMQKLVANIFKKVEDTYKNDKNNDFEVAGYTGYFGPGRPQQSLEKRLKELNVQSGYGVYGDLVYQTKTQLMNCEFSGLNTFAKDEKIWQEASVEKVEAHDQKAKSK